MYQCERCREITEPHISCATQHYKKFEERRCPNCYNAKAEQRFNTEKSLATLQDNIPRLIDKLNSLSERAFDEREKVEAKISRTRQRIAKAKEKLGIVK